MLGPPEGIIYVSGGLGNEDDFGRAEMLLVVICWIVVSCCLICVLLFVGEFELGAVFIAFTHRADSMETVQSSEMICIYMRRLWKYLPLTSSTVPSVESSSLAVLNFIFATISPRYQV